LKTRSCHSFVWIFVRWSFVTHIRFLFPDLIAS
jgi:hypothetical protein